jgi:CheY-like chemotaxis protein
VVSTDDARRRALNAGVVGFLAKPLQSADAVEQALAQLREYVDRPGRRLLVMMAQGELRQSYLDALNAETEAILVDSATVARTQLAGGTIDALVTDGSIADFGPLDLIEATEGLPSVRQLPIVLCDGIDADSAARWAHSHDAFGLRRASDIERLLDATSFFLHRAPGAMSARESEAVRRIDEADTALQGRKVLIVDDDMRNIFALATVLDAQGMVIVSAENGRDAIRWVESDPAIDIVLMDLMMPEVDGMETMRVIRQLGRGQDLPLIAVTAKAMKGDREKCIAAGAWDYLSKPVDTAALLTTLRGWLRQ